MTGSRLAVTLSWPCLLLEPGSPTPSGELGADCPGVPVAICRDAVCTWDP